MNSNRSINNRNPSSQSYQYTYYIKSRGFKNNESNNYNGSNYNLQINSKETILKNNPSFNQTRSNGGNSSKNLENANLQYINKRNKVIKIEGNEIYNTRNKNIQQNNVNYRKKENKNPNRFNPYKRTVMIPQNCNTNHNFRYQNPSTTSRREERLVSNSTNYVPSNSNLKAQPQNSICTSRNIKIMKRIYKDDDTISYSSVDSENTLKNGIMNGDRSIRNKSVHNYDLDIVGVFINVNNLNGKKYLCVPFNLNQFVPCRFKKYFFQIHSNIVANFQFINCSIYKNIKISSRIRYLKSENGNLNPEIFGYNNLNAIKKYEKANYFCSFELPEGLLNYYLNRVESSIHYEVTIFLTLSQKLNGIPYSKTAYVLNGKSIYSNTGINVRKYHEKMNEFYNNRNK